MTISRVFRGHIDRAKSSSLRTGGRQKVLVVMVDPQEAGLLEAALPADLNRAQSVPIAFVVGGPGETLLQITAELDTAPRDAVPDPDRGTVLKALSATAAALEDLRLPANRSVQQLDLIASALAALEGTLRK